MISHESTGYLLPDYRPDPDGALHLSVEDGVNVVRDRTVGGGDNRGRGDDQLRGGDDQAMVTENFTPAITVVGQGFDQVHWRIVCKGEFAADRGINKEF
jgi:hypothetical protein